LVFVEGVVLQGKPYHQLVEAARRYAHDALQHEYIGTEHLLFAVIQDDGSVACEICREAGIDPDKIRWELSKILQPCSHPVWSTEARLTPRARKAVALAEEEAARLGQDELGPELLLLGLLREEEGVAGQVLEYLGMKLESFRHSVKRRL
jgi:ATP-dependent Clp protease ATP-binding subunit ClpC